jgi:pimeloyl-ACP methyl ester carboxylesterase
MHVWTGARGTRIAADSWGDPAGPLVILLHGGGQTRHAWKGVGARLGAAGYNSIAFDARGHGDSDWADDGYYGLKAMIEDLKCIVSLFDGRRPALVGASMGGGTSLAAVGMGEVDASALVLVDFAPIIEKRGVERIRDFMDQKPEGFDSLEDMAAAIARFQPHRKQSTSLEGLAKNVRIDANGKYRWHWDPRFRTARGDLRTRQQLFSDQARGLTLPTLLVRGGMSDFLSEDGARAFLDLCPHSEFVNVSGAGHMIAGDRNDIFGAAVVDFLLRSAPVAKANSTTNAS